MGLLIRREKYLLKQALILWLALLPACAGGSDRSSREEVEAIKAQLLRLRPVAAEFLRVLGPEARVNGIPIALKEGKIFWEDNRHDPPEDLPLVTDAWGHPVVLLRPNDRPEEWCLISAGPDGVWTADPPERLAEYEKDGNRHWYFVPDFKRREGIAERWVVGDDLVLEASGPFYESYPFPKPEARELAGGLLANLRGAGSGGLPFPRYLLEEARSLDPADREKIIEFIENKQAGFYLSEDTWGHDCHRKHGGLLPEVFLCHADFSPSDFYPVTCDPGPKGWEIHGRWDDFLKILFPERFEIPPIPPLAVDFLGQRLEAHGFIFCVEATEEMRRSGVWERLERDLLEAGAEFSSRQEGVDLGWIFFKDTVQRFPDGDSELEPTTLPEKARQFLREQLQFGEEARVADGFRAAIERGNRSMARTLAIIYIGTGKGTSPEGGSEESYLKQTLAATTGMNFKRIPIHGFYVPPQANPSPDRKDFVRQLAAMNQGQFFESQFRP
ncbi:MAG: VWA domain-containing protein [Planctomycetes bacterium]|nr:VWA domain-containing protein [Planctomycetota bacterium]